MKNLYTCTVITAILLLLCVGTSHSQPMAYTDYAVFMADLPGLATTLDFDSLAAGTTIANGVTVGGITVNYNFGGVQMIVTDVFDTTSPPNFLGTDDADVLQDGDDFNLSFSPVNAIGIFFITADIMFDNDIKLTAGGLTAGLDASAGGTPLPDGGIPYFLGIINDMNTFTSASITTIGGGFFLYNVDDITITTKGDFDGDGDIDQNDVNILLSYRNQPASACPSCDLDGDGRITALDARKLVLLCTRPRCATQ
jgi:hypothetical protein